MSDDPTDEQIAEATNDVGPRLFDLVVDEAIAEEQDGNGEAGVTLYAVWADLTLALTEYGWTPEELARDAKAIATKDSVH